MYTARAAAGLVNQAAESISDASGTPGAPRVRAAPAAAIGSVALAGVHDYASCW